MLASWQTCMYLKCTWTTWLCSLKMLGFIARCPIKHACEGSCKQWSIACWNDCCIVSNPTSWRSFILSGKTFFSAQTGASVLSSKKLEMRSFFCEEFMRNINEVYLKERQEILNFVAYCKAKFDFWPHLCCTCFLCGLLLDFTGIHSRFRTKGGLIGREFCASSMEKVPRVITTHFN